MFAITKRFQGRYSCTYVMYLTMLLILTESLFIDLCRIYVVIKQEKT